jgi:hypothetical protein
MKDYSNLTIKLTNALEASAVSANKNRLVRLAYCEVTNVEVKTKLLYAISTQ